MIKIITTGKLKEKYLREAIEEYSKRLSKYTKLEIIELNDYDFDNKQIVLEKEKDIMREQLLNEGKPADRIENILVGKVRKYYEEVCLENQIFVKAENKETVADFVKNNGGTITTMVRFEVGEGMQKREENFADEVAKQMQGK